MADSILGNISQEATLSELLGGMVLLLSAILEKLPRTDGNDRLLTNASEVNSTVAITGAISSVTTVGAVTAVNALQTMGALARPADAIPMHMSNAGAMHIYNNITVS
jgi:hypothetical protein